MHLMCRTVLLLTSSTIALFALAGLSPAADDAADRVQAYEEFDQAYTPIVGRHLHVSAPRYEANPATEACWTADDVLQSFALDIEAVGGDIIIVKDGIQQDLADTWRSIVHGRHVEVSLVLVHIVPDASGNSEAMVDIVEIDGDGCALSRTLLTADDWLALVELASSIEV
jgi:hypothetical protein